MKPLNRTRNATPSSRSRLVRRSALWAAPLAVALALSACSAPSAVIQSTTQPKSGSDASIQQDVNNNDPIKAESSSNGTGMVLHVTNKSSHDLRWVGMKNGPQPATTPEAIIPAGGTDRIVWTHAGSSGLEITPSWQIDGTEYDAYPTFSVPSLGFNGFSCTADDMDKNSPVGPSQCNIGHGWDPDGQVIFINSGK